ncbi:MAG: FecR family protein [Elusimicrobiota bacterium]
MIKKLILLSAAFAIMLSCNYVAARENMADTGKDDISTGEEETSDVPKGDFIFIEGDVQIKEKGSDKWVPVTEETKLSDGTQVKVSDNSFTEIDLGGGKKVELNEESMSGISEQDNNTTLELFYGSLMAKAKKLSKGEKLEVKTPVSVAAVRGTEFAVIHEDESEAEVEVYDGEVSFSKIADDGTAEEGISVGKDNWAKAGKDLKTRVMGEITEKRELRWKHFRLKKEMFLNLRAVKKNDIMIFSLNKKIRMIRDPEKRKSAKARLAKLMQRTDELKKQNNAATDSLAGINKQYRANRLNTAARRKILMQKRRQEQGIK